MPQQIFIDSYYSLIKGSPTLTLNYGIKGKSNDEIEVEMKEVVDIKLADNMTLDCYWFIEKKLSVFRGDGYEIEEYDLDFIKGDFIDPIVKIEKDIYGLTYKETDDDDGGFFLFKIDRETDQFKMIAFDLCIYSSTRDLLILPDRILVIIHENLENKTIFFLFDLNFNLIKEKIEDNYYREPYTNYERNLIIINDINNRNHIFDLDLNHLDLDLEIYYLIKYPGYLISFDRGESDPNSNKNMNKIIYRNGKLIVENTDHIPKLINHSDCIPRSISYYDFLTEQKQIDVDQDSHSAKNYYRRLSADELIKIRALFDLYILYHEKKIDKDFIIHSIEMLPYSHETHMMMREAILSMKRLPGQRLSDMIDQAYNNFIKTKYWYIV